jgi:hypothetical protein
MTLTGVFGARVVTRDFASMIQTLWMDGHSMGWGMRQPRAFTPVSLATTRCAIGSPTGLSGRVR